MSLQPEEIRAIVREEVRRILDAGLMYTTPAPRAAPQPTSKPVAPKPATAQPEFKRGDPMPERVDHLLKEDGMDEMTGTSYWVPKHFLQPADYKLCKDYVLSQGGKYVSRQDSTTGYAYFELPPKGGNQ